MEIIEEEDSSGSNLSTLLAPCCQSKVTSFLPVSGISAISGKFIAAIIRKRRRSSMTKSFVSLSSVCCHRRRRYVTHTHTSCWVWQFAFFFLPFRLATHHFNDMHELAASYWFILSGDVRACVSGVLWKKKRKKLSVSLKGFYLVLFCFYTQQQGKGWPLSRLNRSNSSPFPNDAQEVPAAFCVATALKYVLVANRSIFFFFFFFGFGFQ